MLYVATLSQFMMHGQSLYFITEKKLFSFFNCIEFPRSSKEILHTFIPLNCVLIEKKL